MPLCICTGCAFCLEPTSSLKAQVQTTSLPGSVPSPPSPPCPSELPLPRLGSRSPFSLIGPKVSPYSLQKPSRVLMALPHALPDKSRPVLEHAPHAHRPTNTLRHRYSPSNWLPQPCRPISHQGSHVSWTRGPGPIPLECSQQANPSRLKDTQRHPLLGSMGSPGCTFTPVHTPEQGSSSSCSGGSPPGLPTCLGFPSRSWSSARFFSWRGQRERGAPVS